MLDTRGRGGNKTGALPSRTYSLERDREHRKEMDSTQRVRKCVPGRIRKVHFRKMPFSSPDKDK